jgi:hypothetical protein
MSGQPRCFDRGAHSCNVVSMCGLLLLDNIPGKCVSVWEGPKSWEPGPAHWTFPRLAEKESQQ